MALIIDPDFLNQGTEVTINTTAKTITLNIAGNLSADGVTLQCLYSFLKEEWKQDSALIKFPFSMLAITEEKFELINSWDFGTTGTRNLIRTGGWALNPAGTIQEMYACIVTLGTLGTSDQVYYQQVTDGVSTNTVLTGVMNQAVKVYGDATHGNFDYRTYFKIFCREYAKFYAMSQISDIGVTTMTYQTYRFPLTNSADLKIVNTDTDLIGGAIYFGTATLTRTDGDVTASSANITSAVGGFVAGDVGKYICIKLGANKGFYKIVTYTSTNVVAVERNFGTTQSAIAFTANPEGMKIDWYAGAQARNIGGTNYNFHAIINGNSGTAEQIYTFIQYQLRQNNDIDNQATSKIGKTTNALLLFTGDALATLLYITGHGTFIDAFSATDTNRLSFTDDTGVLRTFPYVAALTIIFGDNLTADANAKYWVFFTNDDAPGDNLGYDFGTSNAIIVNTSLTNTTTYRSRTSNVATLTTLNVHSLSIGDGVVVSGVGGTGYNGVQIITAIPTTTSFSYANTGANEANTADTAGTITRQMVGNVNGAVSVQFPYAYTANVQRGSGSGGSNAPITTVAIGLSTSQYVKAVSTIIQSTQNSTSLVSALERNYSNP